MANVTTNFWGVVVELDNDETTKFTQGAAGAAGSIGPTILAACAATTVAAPVCAAVAAAVGAYFGALGWVAAQVNKGCGIYLTLPWLAIYTGQIYALVPTTRPCVVGLPEAGWAAKGAGEFGTNDPWDTIGYHVDHGAVGGDVVEFALVIGPQSSGWDKSLFMPDGEGNEWEIKATGGPGGAASNGLWAHQVHNGQQLRFHKPKEFGIWHQVLVLGWLYDLQGGDRCTFTWLKD